MIVGNPYVDPYTNAVTQFQTLYMHGIIPKYPSYQPWINHCSHDRQKYMKKGVSMVVLVSFGAMCGLSPLLRRLGSHSFLFVFISGDLSLTFSLPLHNEFQIRNVYPI